MDKAEAQVILDRVINRLRDKNYNELVNLMDEPVWIIEKSESGLEYQVQIETFWDDKAGEDIRCAVAIDDGGFWSFMFPRSEDFIKNSNNGFVGE